MEPRLIIFTDEKRLRFEGIIASEKEVLIKIDNFSILDGLVTLIATYYAFDVRYPKSLPAQSLLLFIQEYLLESKDPHARHCAKYKSFVNTLFEQ